jgi:hypothetical protein
MKNIYSKNVISKFWINILQNLTTKFYTKYLTKLNY